MSLIDLAELPRIIMPQLSPDGRVLIYLQSHADWKLGRPIWQLWRQDVGGGAPAQLTFGAAGDIPIQPRWSPDSTSILFVRDGQLQLMAASGGDGPNDARSNAGDVYVVYGYCTPLTSQCLTVSGSCTTYHLAMDSTCGNNCDACASNATTGVLLSNGGPAGAYCAVDEAPCMGTGTCEGRNQDGLWEGHAIEDVATDPVAHLEPSEEGRIVGVLRELGEEQARPLDARQLAGAQDYEALPVVRHFEREEGQQSKRAEADAGKQEPGHKQQPTDCAENNGDEQGDGIHGEASAFEK
jgi:hypothetical protein